MTNAIAPNSASANPIAPLLDYEPGVLFGADIKAGGPEPLLTFSVRTYGAVGDGVTDDTGAIHAARDAAGVGGIVVFPPGTYLTSGLSLMTAQQVWQIMAGATVKSKGSDATAGPITVDAPQVTITGGGAVDGNRSIIGGNAHRWSCITGTVNASDLTVEGITVQNSIFYGVWGQASRTRVLRCRFTGNYTVPILLSSFYQAVEAGSTMQDTYDMEASDNFVDRSDEDPATLANAALQIRGNSDPAGLLHATYRGKALRNTIVMPLNPANTEGRVCGIEFGAQSYYGRAEGNKIVNGTMGISFAKAAHGSVIGNTLIGQTLYGIEIADSPSCVVQANTIDGSGRLGSLPSGCGITTDGSAGTSTDASIVGNHIFGIHDSGRGMSLSFARVTVTGNTVASKYGMTLTKVSAANISSNLIVGSGTGPGVQLVNCNDVVVSGNTLRSKYVGIQVIGSSGPVDHLDISNNRFQECTVPIDVVKGSDAPNSNSITQDGKVVGPP